MKKENEAIIWLTIIKRIESNNNQGVKKEELFEHTKLLELFPSELKHYPDGTPTYEDVQADRAGMMIMDCYDDISMKFELNPEEAKKFGPNYMPREELVKFITIKDLAEHFIHQLETIKPDL